MPDTVATEFDDFYARLETVGSGTLAVIAAFPEIGAVGSLPEIGRAIEATIASLRQSGARVTVVRTLWARAALLGPAEEMNRVVAHVAHAQTMFGTGVEMRAVVAQCSEVLPAIELVEQLDDELSTRKNFGTVATGPVVRLVNGRVESATVAHRRG